MIDRLNIFFKEVVTLWNRQRRNWRIIVIGNIFNRIFQRLTTDYSGVYALKLGANPFQLGLLNSVWGFTFSLSSLPMGWFHDRYGLKKIFLTGIGIKLISPLIYALATDWIMLIPAMITLSLGQVIGSCMIICDISLNRKDRSTGKSICESIGMIPSIFAPSIAAYLISGFGGIDVKGIKPLYWIQFAGSIVLFLFFARFLTEIGKVESSKMEKGFKEDFKEVFTRGKALKRYLLIYVLSRFASMMTITFRMPFSHEIKGVDQFLIGVMSTSTILVYIMFAVPLGRLADKIGRKKIFFTLAPLIAASNLLFILANSPELLILSSILLGFQDIANFTIISAMRADLVPQDCIGRWDGIVNMFTGFISIPAPIVGGILWEAYNPIYIFLVPMIIFLLLIPVMSTIPKQFN